MIRKCIKRIDICSRERERAKICASSSDNNNKEEEKKRKKMKDRLRMILFSLDARCSPILPLLHGMARTDHHRFFIFNTIIYRTTHAVT